MADAPADLDQRLAEATERLGDAARAMLRRAAVTERLSLTQAQLLLRLATDAHLGTGALAGRLSVSAPTVSDALGSLAAKGLLERDAPRRWALTARGEQVAHRLAAWRDPLLAALRNQPVEAKADALAVLLTGIAELNRAGLISTARTCLTCRFFDQHAEADAWCGLLETSLAPADLRVDCPEHEPASQEISASPGSASATTSPRTAAR